MVVEDREVNEELCVTKLYVKDGVLQRKMVRKDQQDPASPFCTKQLKDIPATRNQGGGHQVPRLVDVAKCHACHAK